MIAKPQILVVDDDSAWLETLAEFLGEKGYDVLTASDVSTALELLEKRLPRVVLVDVNMPGQDGFEFLRRTRRRRNTIVLLVTGDDDEALHARARAEGAFTLLSKAASPALLLRTVQRAIAAASPGALGWLSLRRAGYLVPFVGPDSRRT
jgi:CheY-like chemotaxis protein